MTYWTEHEIFSKNQKRLIDEEKHKNNDFYEYYLLLEAKNIKREMRKLKRQGMQELNIYKDYIHRLNQINYEQQTIKIHVLSQGRRRH